MKKKLIDGFSLWAILIVAVVAIVAVGLFNRFAPDTAAKLEGSDMGGGATGG